MARAISRPFASERLLIVEPAEARTPETARHSGRWRAFFWERHPKYWLIGSVLFLGRLSALLPFRLMLALGWPLGMAIKRDNTQLGEALTAAMIEIQRDGTLDRIFAEHGITRRTP